MTGCLNCQLFGGEEYAKIVMRVLTDAIDAMLKLRAAGLSHEAVIEIMIALLGFMIAVLTLIAGLVSFGVAALAIFGFAEIKKSALRIAEGIAQKTAEDVASEVATSIAIKTAEKYQKSLLGAAQATAYSEGEAEDLANTERPETHAAGGKRKATTDKNLRNQP